MKLLISTALAASLLSVAACGGQSTLAAHPAASAPASKAPAASTPAATRQTAAPAVPVLHPAGTVTFTVQELDTPTSVTWTVGKVVTVQHGTDPLGPAAGYKYIAFPLTARDNGPATASANYQSYLVWQGADGRTDNSIANTGATVTDPASLGLTGTNIGLSGDLSPGQYVSGYVVWQVPTAPGSIELMSSNASTLAKTTALKIDYGS
jgi:hypothetical protein